MNGKQGDLTGMTSGNGEQTSAPSVVVPVSADRTPSSDTLDIIRTTHEIAWGLGNILLTSLYVSAGIVAVQSPVRTALLRMTYQSPTNAISVIQAETPIGNRATRFVGATKSLYAGTGAGMKSALIRSLYTNGVRDNIKRVEEVNNESGKKISPSQVNFEKFLHVQAAALFELFLTQVPDAKSAFLKTGIISSEHEIKKTVGNYRRMIWSGSLARFSSGVVSFGGLCMLEDKIASYLPKEHPCLDHTVSGAITGVVVAVPAYPLALYQDYKSAQTKVVNGNVINKSCFSIAQELWQQHRQRPLKAVQTFVGNAMIQVPIRAGLTATIFSVIAGVNAAVGKAPLEKVVSSSYNPRLSFFKGGQEGSKAPALSVVAPPVTIAPVIATNSEDDYFTSLTI